MKTIIFLALIVIGWQTFGGEISDYYFKNAEDHPNSHESRMAEMKKSRSWAEITSTTNHGITEIGIERTACFGTCPSFTFIVKDDGSFKYSGGSYAKRTGDFTGTIPEWKFLEIAHFIHDSEYMSLEDSYRTSVTDEPTTYTMVVMNGKKKVISNYADAGPTKLWAIEQLIEDLMNDAEWKAVSKSPAETK